ncbi:MAG: hypothetical protein KGH69_04895 [Candidatus Micrarchaeota archaeon]|nr:hypothetical protein [Candidatus Micrarchaeota archaeon]
MATKGKGSMEGLARSVTASVIDDFVSMGIPRDAFRTLKIRATDLRRYKPGIDGFTTAAMYSNKNETLHINTEFLEIYLERRKERHGGYFRAALRQYAAHELTHRVIDLTVTATEGQRQSNRWKAVFMMNHEAVAYLAAHVIGHSGSYYDRHIRSNTISNISLHSSPLETSLSSNPLERRKVTMTVNDILYNVGSIMGDAAYLGISSEMELQRQLCAAALMETDPLNSLAAIAKVAVRSGYVSREAALYYNAFVYGNEERSVSRALKTIRRREEKEKQ